MIEKRLPKDIYCRCITFMYGTADEINRRMKRLHGADCFGDLGSIGPSTDGRWMMIETHGYQADYILLVKKPRRTLRQITSILVHETLHCASHALRTARIEHTWETEEAYTYYQTMLFEECMRVMP